MSASEYILCEKCGVKLIYTELAVLDESRPIAYCARCFLQLQAELEKYRWIPVSERLPEKGFCHLYMPEFNSNCPQKGWYLSDKKVWMTTIKSHSRTRKVTHWKPIILPEEEL